MGRSVSEGCPSRYKKEIMALRRLETAVEADPNLPAAKIKVSKVRIRAVIDDLAELVRISEDHAKPEGHENLQKRRGRNSVGHYHDGM